MLDAFIIDSQRRRREQDQPKQEQPRLELPIAPYEQDERQHQPVDDPERERGSVVIDYTVSRF